MTKYKIRDKVFYTKYRRILSWKIVWVNINKFGDEIYLINSKENRVNVSRISKDKYYLLNRIRMFYLIDISNILNTMPRHYEKIRKMKFTREIKDMVEKNGEKSKWCFKCNEWIKY